MNYLQASRSRYGPCDSFFVEAADDGIYARRAEERERQRAINRMHQRQLAGHLSRVTADEYEHDILEHMEYMEAETMPDVNSIDIQTEIQWFMRPYLLDFLIEAHNAFQLLPETLYLAVNLLDRYCSKRIVYKKHYQLVGCAALLIASKYGDKKERVPTIRELKSMCCSLYDDEMFTQMEWHVLQTLNWMVGHPTVDSFLQLAISDDPEDPEVEHMTWYLCEIALYHREFVSTRPSVLARSALALSRCILSRPQARYDDWAGTYDSQVIMKLSQQLYHPSQVLSRKYASMHLSSVATTLEGFLQRQLELARQHSTPPSPAVVQEQKPSAEIYLNPQTPQKTPFGTAVVQNGCLTPPITPDNEFGPSGYSKSQEVPGPQAFPPTPTPITHSNAPSIYDYQRYLHPQPVQ